MASSTFKEDRSNENDRRTPLVTESSKNITVNNFTGISRDSSEKSLKSHKGLKVTKYMNVQELCDMKLRGKGSEEGERNMKRTQKNKELYIQKVLREVSCVLLDYQISGRLLGYLELTRVLEKM